jgi:uncharacterized protein YqjF (DUF2071 family)
MNALGQPTLSAEMPLPTSPCAAPLFIADWTGALFLHYEIAARELQPFVPFQLDLWEGRAFISLVAFTMRNMRFARLGALGVWLCKPIATHEFLNLRTYVRHGNETGICFLTEWLPNRLSLLLGPLLYSLPYRHAAIHYSHGEKVLHGRVSARTGSFCYEGNLHNDLFAECAADSREYFLLERYAAFNAGPPGPGSSRIIRRLFRVKHEPWLQTPARVEVTENSLVRHAMPWWNKARFCGANYSPGARDVRMSAPQRVEVTADNSMRQQETGSHCHKNQTGRERRALPVLR